MTVSICYYVIILAYSAPGGDLWTKNEESVVKPSKWTYRDAFLIPRFWPFKNHWTCQISCFLIRRMLKKPFFYLTSHQGVLFFQNKESVVRPSKWTYRDAFLIPCFWPFKNHWTCQISCFLIRRMLKKPFFYPTSPQGVLLCQNKSQLSDLQNGHIEMLF